MINAESLVMIVLLILSQTGISRPTTTAVQVVVIGKKQIPDVQATVYGAAWCAPCLAYSKSIRDEMPKGRWIAKDDADKESKYADIVLTKSETDWKRLGILSIPCTIIRDASGKELDRFTGAKTPDELSKRLAESAAKNK